MQQYIDSNPALSVRLLQFFFQRLYHQFAWSYNLVAYLVSLGQWHEWISTSYEFLDDRPILELGFGTGYLQHDLLKKNILLYGVDESSQMANRTWRDLTRSGFKPRLVRAVSQMLPFPDQYFGSVVATFPSEYILDPDTFPEVKRVLKPGGKLVICPIAWITGRNYPQRAAAVLFRITNEAPPMNEFLAGPLRYSIDQLSEFGFDAAYRLVPLKSSKVLVITARKIEKD